MGNVLGFKLEGTGSRIKLGPLPSKVTALKGKTKKIGRNAPCPCGSGKKYKKCCLNKN
jgi:hypothetical protein